MSERLLIGMVWAFVAVFLVAALVSAAEKKWQDPDEEEHANPDPYSTPVPVPPPTATPLPAPTATRWRPPTATPVTPTATRPRPPTSTPVTPTATRPRPPTSTPVTPTATRPRPPTSTPVTPTATRPRPPTATPVPATATPVGYASLIASPGPAWRCKNFPRGPGVRKLVSQARVQDPGGNQVTVVEIYATRQSLDSFLYYAAVNQFCVEARFTAESTPGSAHISWTGSLVESPLKLDATELERERADISDLNRFLTLYTEDEPGRAHTADGRTASLVCRWCRGGTAQTDRTRPENRSPGYMIVEAM